MDTQNIFCGDCTKELDNLEDNCPFCNSAKKHIRLEFTEEIEIHEVLKGKKKNSELSGKKGILEEFFDGDSRSANGDWAYKQQTISRERDYYFEQVKNSKGEVIRFCEEPLSEHRGRGSDKFKKDEPDKN